MGHTVPLMMKDETMQSSEVEQYGGLLELAHQPHRKSEFILVLTQDEHCVPFVLQSYKITEKYQKAMLKSHKDKCLND